MKLPSFGLQSRMKSSPVTTPQKQQPGATASVGCQTPPKRHKVKVHKTLDYTELYQDNTQGDEQDEGGESTEVEEMSTGKPDYISTTALHIPVYACPILTLSKEKNNPLIAIPESVVDKLCQFTIDNMKSQVYALNKSIGLVDKYPTVGMMKEVAMKLCRYYPALYQLPVKAGKQRAIRGARGVRWVSNNVFK